MSGPGHVSRFDAFRLSARRGSISGSLDARSLPNVADSLAAGDDPVRVDWTIDGLASAEGRPALAIAIEAEVPLVCQRCLGRMAWNVSQSTEVLLAHDEGELASLDEGSEGEVILADRPLDAATLVEDELVLTLPFAPRHEGGCAPVRQ